MTPGQYTKLAALLSRTAAGLREDWSLYLFSDGSIHAVRAELRHGEFPAGWAEDVESWHMQPCSIRPALCGKSSRHGKCQIWMPSAPAT